MCFGTTIQNNNTYNLVQDFTPVSPEYVTYSQYVESAAAAQYSFTTYYIFTRAVSDIRQHSNLQMGCTDVFYFFEFILDISFSDTADIYQFLDYILAYHDSMLTTSLLLQDCFYINSPAFVLFLSEPEKLQSIFNIYACLNAVDMCYVYIALITVFSIFTVKVNFILFIDIKFNEIVLITYIDTFLIEVPCLFISNFLDFSVDLENVLLEQNYMHEVLYISSNSWYFSDSIVFNKHSQRNQVAALFNSGSYVYNF